MLFSLGTSDEGVCANREELGMGKVLGDVKLWAKGNTWWGTGSRDGEDRSWYRHRAFFRFTRLPRRRGCRGAQGNAP